jgi:PilZ domain
MIEKRASPRYRVLKQGTIAFRGGGRIDCMVRNISQGGARLEVATPFGLHGSFTLAIASDHFTRDCRAVWNIEQHVGVAFE